MISRPAKNTPDSDQQTSYLIYEECEWRISPPPHKILRLKIDTSEISSGKFAL